MTRDWSRLFASTGFRWQIGLRAGDVEAFFAPTAEHDEIMAERAQWLDQAGADYAVLIETGRPLLAETGEIAVSSGLIKSGADTSLESLGRTLEPDFVLLLPASGGPLVVGGVVCFPSCWS